MLDKTRVFESFGIYISIVFKRNLDRKEAWVFAISTVEDGLFTSRSFYNYNECVIEALKKAVEYLDYA